MQQSKISTSPFSVYQILSNGLSIPMIFGLVVLLGLFFSPLNASADDEQLPKTQEEIEAYKQTLIEDYLQRVGAARNKTPVKIDSLTELANYAGKSNVHVRMKPGTYDITLENYTKFLDTLEEIDGYANLIHFSGDHSLYDLRGVTLRIDTRILPSYARELDIDPGKHGMEEVLVTGNNLIIRGLSIKDVHEIRPEPPESVRAKIVETDASHRPDRVNYSFDGSEHTWFSAKGDSEWVMYRLNRTITMDSVTIQARDKRADFSFEIQIANGDTDWETVYEGETREDGEPKTYTFDPVKADRVRLVGHGDQRNWNVFSEVRIDDLNWPAAYPEGKNYAPSRSARTLKVLGEHILFHDVTVMSRGSQPYGYGRLLGKGGGSPVALHKHSAVASGGDQLAFVECEVYPRSYGHAWGWGLNNDITAINCYIEGEIRSTNDMLEETNSPVARADYQNYWTDERIKPGMVVSLHEDTFRSYPHPYKPKGRKPGTVRLLGCTVKYTSSGTALAGAYKGDVYISNMTAIGNTQRGYAVPSGATIVNSSSDIRYAPALQMRPSNDITIDLNLLPSPTPETVNRHRQPGQYDIKYDNTPGGYTKYTAFIVGDNHEISLSANKDLQLSEPIPIVLGYSRGKYKSAENVELKNTTGLPIILTKKTENCTIHTNGKVIDNGENNTIKRLSR